jgi:hypothetical protein
VDLFFVESTGTSVQGCFSFLAEILENHIKS